MAGPYRVAILLEKPKGFYRFAGKEQEWVNPVGNAFLGVVVRDGYDRRVVPELEVKVSVMDDQGKLIEEKVLPFGWFPLLNRYGENLLLSDKGNYRFKVEISPPSFLRHDPVNGDRYPEKATAEFDQVYFQEDSLPEPVREDNQSEWLPLAKAQGSALQQALDNMISGVATDGSEVKSGDYLLAYADEYAEGYWEKRHGKLVYNTRVENCTEKNGHVEVAVMDALTGRFLPALDVTTTFLLGDDSVNSYHPGLMWHPWIYHYGGEHKGAGQQNL